ncbi:unnamed protein product [Effrenium voratum]|nr:unnamed protein product [Effrenium voratum]
MLVPMFDAERKNALLWLEQQVWDSGGTNFVTAMDSAFNVISSSVSAGKTSMCQKARWIGESSRLGRWGVSSEIYLNHGGRSKRHPVVPKSGKPKGGCDL